MTDETRVENNVVETGGKTPVLGYVIGFVVLLALAAGLWWFIGNNNDSPEGISVAGDVNANQGTLEANYPDVVATVNGKDITGEQMSNNVLQTAATAQAQGVDISNAETLAQIESQSLTTLVNTELLLQAATEAGITASDEDVNAQISALETQLGGAEAMEAQMQASGVTIDALRADMDRQIVINSYIEQNVDLDSVVVTDAEVSALYESLIIGVENAPALVEVEAQIRQQIVSEKQQALIAELLENLRVGAEINVLI